MLHKGHRSRVRANIMRNGTDAFEVHELFEALLFYAIPYRDTNPTAHLLCNAFGTPMGVFRADTAALCSLSGIGAATADFLHLCGSIADAIENERAVMPVYNTPEKAGARFVEAFRGVKEEKVMMLLLNNRSEMLFLGDVHKGSVNSARLRPATLIRYALLHHASFVYIAHNHKSNLPIPTQNDVNTAEIMRNGMRTAGIPSSEHFLIAGDRYVPLYHYEYKKRLSGNELFVGAGNAWTNADATLLPKTEEAEKKKAVKEGKSYLVSLLSYVNAETAAAKATRLLAYFTGLSNVLRASCTDLTAVEGIGEMDAVLLRVVGALLFRTKPTVPKKNEKVTLEQAAEYVRDFCKGNLREDVCMILLDKRGCFIDAVKISEGVANSALFLGRQLLEAAVYRHADRVIVAHTHPDGDPYPSKDDIDHTESLKNVFLNAGIEFVEHLIVTDHSYYPIIERLKEREMEIDRYP